MNGARCYSADLEQGGLEISVCPLIFRGTSEYIEKIKGKLKKAPKECCETVIQPEDSEGSTKPIWTFWAFISMSYFMSMTYF